MQLHSLAFAALGPFRDPQRIDFAGLAAGGLFLLDGPTGAGKSTIIDALVFALYGQVAGGHSSKQRLVSDHRDPGVEPFVELVFETGAGVYRVRRTPEYRRPKKRGAGTVAQQATIRLWKGTSPSGLDGDPVSIRAGEADAEIRDAIGLSRDQFVKTVVLPQGEFARFLQSRVDDRREILQSIFGTAHFDQVQNELKRRRAVVRQACADADHAVRFASRAFADTAAVAEDARQAAESLTDQLLAVAGSDAAAAGTALTAWADRTVDDLAAAHAEVEVRRGTAASERDAAAAKLSAVQHRQQLRNRLREALAEKAVLDAGRADHVARDAALDAGRRAAACRPALEALDAARGRLDDVTVRVERLRATTVLPGVDIAVASPKDIDHVRGRLRDVITGLTEVRQLEAELPNRRDEIRTLARDRQKHAETLAEVVAVCTSLPGEIDAARAELAEARATASAATDLLTRRAEVLDLIDDHERLVARRAAHKAADDACRASLVRLSAAHDAEAELRRRYLAGIAAELAAELVDGSPCHVCGSTHHPEPRRPAADHVGRAQVDAAEQERQSLHHRLETQRTTRDTEAAAVAELEGRLGGRTADDLDAEFAALTAAIAEAEAAQLRVEQLDGEIVRLQQRLARGRDEQRATEAAIAAADTHVAVLEARLVQDESRVAEGRSEFGSVNARVDDLARRATAADQLARALADLHERTADHARRRDELSRVVIDVGFGTDDDARSALLSPSQLRSLEAHVEQWRRRDDEIRGRLAAPDLVGVDPDEDIDVAESQHRAEAAQRALDDLIAAATTAADRHDAARLSASRLSVAVDDRRRRHAEATPVIRMAGLACADDADNALRMTLTTYVLQRRFDSVVEAANERLADMSSGRYALASHDGKEAGSRRTGLGLQVVDAHTGQARDTGTLSGGETFYVSLSLALGLADVVTSEAGGLTMGTLFVDEGFGSLDSATLDTVMGVLSALRSGGRMVGVVSHVEDLKHRIPERIEVRRPHAGAPSTLTVVA